MQRKASGRFTIEHDNLINAMNFHASCLDNDGVHVSRPGKDGSGDWCGHGADAVNAPVL